MTDTQTDRRKRFYNLSHAMRDRQIDPATEIALTLSVRAQ